MLRNEDGKNKEKRSFMDDPWEPTGKRQTFSQGFFNSSSTKAVMSGLDAGLSSILEEDESTSDFEIKTIPLNKPQIETTKKDEILAEYISLIDMASQNNMLDIITMFLDLLKDQNLLVPYLSAVKYKIAFWAFEHESKIVLEELFRAPEKRHQFLVVCHNNYQITKEFLHRTIQLAFEEFQQQVESKQYILNLLLQTKTHLLEPVIKTVIDEYTNNAQVDRKTVNALQLMVNEITNELTEKLADEVHVENSMFQAPRFN